MKKAPLSLALAACVLGASVPAHAQSNVKIYGLISAGIGYASNENGGGRLHALSGTNQSPRWGLQGKEDLGGGREAVFVLEQGFNVMTGTVSQNGRAFGRQSFVGLSDKSLGILTLGRQYDTVHDYLGPVLIASNGVNIGDNDNSYNNIRIQNAVKYVSPRMQGFDFTAVYGLGEGARSNDNRAYSLGVGYKRGGLSVGAAHAVMDKPNSRTSPNGAVGNDYASGLLLFNKSPLDNKTGVDSQRISGVGGLYRVGPAVYGAFFSNVEYHYLDRSQLTLRNFDVNVNYSVATNIILGLSYTLTSGKYDALHTRPKWHQVNLQANYVLSKRSDLFANMLMQRAAGDAQHAQIFGFGASSSRQQAVMTVGMRHRF